MKTDLDKLMEAGTREAWRKQLVGDIAYLLSQLISGGIAVAVGYKLGWAYGVALFSVCTVLIDIRYKLGLIVRKLEG